MTARRITVARNPSELDEKFQEQIKLLRLSCMNYDCGFEFAALQIATSLRVFLIDSPESLLTHIGIRNTMEFIDTRCEMTNDISCGLIYLYTSTPWKKENSDWDYENFKYTYIPFCHTPVEESFLERATFTYFNDWMEQPICHNKTIPAELTRSQIIKITSNQEGGAHVDKEIDEIYNYFRFPDSPLNGEKKDIASKFRFKIVNTLIQPVLRQLGNELLLSFKKANLLNDDIIINWFKYIDEANKYQKSITERKLESQRKRKALILKIRNEDPDNEIKQIRATKNINEQLKTALINGIYTRRIIEQSKELDKQDEYLKSDEQRLNERTISYLKYFNI